MTCIVCVVSHAGHQQRVAYGRGYLHSLPLAAILYVFARHINIMFKDGTPGIDGPAALGAIQGTDGVVSKHLRCVRERYPEADDLCHCLVVY